MSEFEDYVRKQFPVQAARVTPQNIEELAEACGGKIMHDGEKEGNFSRDYIKVLVQYPKNDRQTQAHVGDWLVKQGRNYKVYLDKAFRATFEFPNGESLPGGNQQRRNNQGQQKQRHRGPSPANMPKKVLKAEAGPELTSVPEGTPATSADLDGDKQVVEETFQDVVETSPEVVSNGFDEINQEIRDKINVEFDKVDEQTLEGEGLPMPSPSVQHAHASAEPCDEDVCPDRYVDGEHIFTDRTILATPEGNTEVEEPKKSITLDELNDQVGDPRSAQEINAEA